MIKEKFPKDKRDKLWTELEGKIQSRGEKKDKSFKLGGAWKKYIRKQDGFKIYKVDGEWLRNNISVVFGHGGHGYVHEFIPLDEIWVDTHHYKGCVCKKVRKDRALSENCFNSTVLHEITEFHEMKKGKIYWIGHNIALKKEKEAGFLKDPYTESY